MPRRVITLYTTWSEESSDDTSRERVAVYTLDTDGTFGDALRRVLAHDYGVELLDPVARFIELAEHLATPSHALLRLPSDPLLEWLEDSHRGLGVTRSSLLAVPLVAKQLQQWQSQPDTLLLGALAANLRDLDTDGRFTLDTTVNWDPTSS